MSILCFQSEFPSTLYAGDSFSFRYSNTDHPRSGGWALTLQLNGPESLEVLGAEDPDNADAFLLEEGSSDTADWDAGFYAWVLYASKDDERRTLLRGTIEILADPAEIEAPSEARSFARQALEAIETIIKTKSDTLSFSVFGRSYQYHSFDQLLAARREFVRLIEQQEEDARRAKGEPNRSFVAFRF